MAWQDPTYGPNAQLFSDYITAQRLTKLEEYWFGTAQTAGTPIKTLTDLGTYFHPYGIAGTSPIEEEWERYTAFNTANHNISDYQLYLTATKDAGAGAAPANGTLNSGQIITKNTYMPGDGKNTIYGFDGFVKIPAAIGAWPAFWLYPQHTADGSHIVDSSEVDIFEFHNTNPANISGPTNFSGNLHGPGVGSTIWTLENSSGVYNSPVNYSQDWHHFQCIWTPDVVAHYIDNILVDMKRYTYTATNNPPELYFDLAVGSDLVDMHINNIPDWSQFPIQFGVKAVTIYGSGLV